MIDLPDGSQGGQSWGVVDDTCDGIVRVAIEMGSLRFSAMARVSAGPPDFAPDRRPFASLADDLADRELPALTDAEIADPITVTEVADLLRRVFETVSLTNLDALRTTMLRQNSAGDGPVPHTDRRRLPCRGDRERPCQLRLHPRLAGLLSAGVSRCGHPSTRAAFGR